MPPSNTSHHDGVRASDWQSNPEYQQRTYRHSHGWMVTDDTSDDVQFHFRYQMYQATQPPDPDWLSTIRESCDSDEPPTIQRSESFLIEE